ncbi:MAG: M48 family metallopeptidase [Candidatus Thermoplasmatota archaeon]|nr:M48 family metallopeptidase [Candidatus Thermoplasmatota archaeon]
MSSYTGIYVYYTLRGKERFHAPPVPDFLVKYDYRNLYADLDSHLSEKYTKTLDKISGSDIKIYLFSNTGRFAPAFVVNKDQKPLIYVDRDFIDYLDEDEFKALILHELGHFKHKVRGIFPMDKMFIFSFLFSLLSFVILINIRAVVFLYIVPLFLLSVSIFSIFMHLNSVKNSEIVADAFVIKCGVDKAKVISMITKVMEFERIKYNRKLYFTRNRKNLEKRLEKLERV